MQNMSANRQSSLNRYHLGCPVWNLANWKGILFSEDAKHHEHLTEYSAVFNSVEGNTSFYGLPREETLKRWAKDSHADFRFCLKLPKTITHDNRLVSVSRELTSFYQTIERLNDKVGLVHIQLPPSFSGQDIDALKSLIAQLSAHHQHCVEVRHLDFFDKASNEKRLNHLLHSHNINRTCFDSRGLFKAKPNTPAIIPAQKKKPRLPVHAYALANQPMVRFISHPDFTINRPYLEQWSIKVAQWINEGKTPYVFIHTANNIEAPLVARQFHQLLQRQVTEIADLPAFPAELAKQSQLALI